MLYVPIFIFLCFIYLFLSFLLIIIIPKVKVGIHIMYLCIYGRGIVFYGGMCGSHFRIGPLGTWKIHTIMNENFPNI